jgi:hypothetical protein
MRRLECARPARTSTGHARNAGEAVQQLAHIARERQRLGQEHKSLMRRIRKIDARLAAMTMLEHKLLPMMQQAADRVAVSAAKSSASPPPAAPPVRRPVALPLGLNQVTLQY